MKTSNIQILASNFVLVVAQWLSHIHGLQNDRLLHSTPSLGSLLKFKFMSIESMRPSNHLSLGRPLLLLPSVFPSIRVFSSESDLQIRWPNYWSFISVLSMNIQGWFLLGLTGLISLLFKGLSGVFSSTIVQKHQFFHAQPSLWPKLSHPYMTTGKTITDYYRPLSAKWCLCAFLS